MLRNILGRVVALAFAALFFHVAHGADLKIDGTSKETFERSTKAMADTLSNADREIFASGLLNLILTEYPPARGLDGFALLAIGSQAVEAAHITMNGKTMSEIMERGRSIAKNKDVANDTHACSQGETKDLIKITDWTIKPVTNDTNQMTETLAYSGTKATRMIDGSIRYSDVLGGRIASKAIDRDVSIEPGKSYLQTGNWGPYTFERMLKMNRSDVIVVACVRAVVYADGTKQTF